MSDPGYTDGGELKWRIEVMERNSAQLAKDVKDGFEAQAKNLSAISTEFSKSLQGLNDRVNTSGKPNWQIAIAAASFCFLVITGFVTMIKGPTDQSIAELKAITSIHTAAMPQFLTKEDYRYERDRNIALTQRSIDSVDRRSEEGDKRFEEYRTRHER